MLKSDRGFCWKAVGILPQLDSTIAQGGTHTDARVQSTVRQRVDIPPLVYSQNLARKASSPRPSTSPYPLMSRPGPPEGLSCPSGGRPRPSSGCHPPVWVQSLALWQDNRYPRESIARHRVGLRLPAHEPSRYPDKGSSTRQCTVPGRRGC